MRNSNFYIEQLSYSRECKHWTDEIGLWLIYHMNIIFVVKYQVFRKASSLLRFAEVSLNKPLTVNQTWKMKQIDYQYTAWLVICIRNTQVDAVYGWVICSLVITVHYDIHNGTSPKCVVNSTYLLPDNIYCIQLLRNTMSSQWSFKIVSF